MGNTVNSVALYHGQLTLILPFDPITSTSSAVPKTRDASRCAVVPPSNCKIILAYSSTPVAAMWENDLISRGSPKSSVDKKIQYTPMSNTVPPPSALLYNLPSKFLGAAN